MERAIITTSWDDGHPLDLKLAELLNKYGIPGTFYIPIERVKRGCMSPDDMREISRSFDVGGHTYHHVRLPGVPPDEAEREIVDGKLRLEEITGRQLFSFCYPYGEYNDRVVSLVKDAGFIGARTMRSLTRRLNDPYRMGSTVYALDWQLSRYIRHSISSQDLRFLCFLLRSNLFLKGWDRIAMETLDFVVGNGGIWHLWGHSWELDDNGDWRRLESVLERISSLSGHATLVDNTHLLAMHPNSS